MNGALTTTVEERWQQFFRWGPYGLLAVAGLLVAASADQLMHGPGTVVAGAMFAAVLALQLWWTAYQRAVAETSGEPSRETSHEPSREPSLLTVPGAPGPASVFYFTVRTGLAFALTWTNPFFAVFACMGYFDAVRLLPPRPAAARAGLHVVPLTLAGSQSGGLPPRNLIQWVAFAGLFVLNGCLAVGLSHLGVKEAEKARERAATIEALARANARLEEALEENAALQAQLLVQAREAGVADERRRLAAEIHDTIAQGLAGVITQLQAVGATTDPELARLRLRRASDLARHSLGEARRSVQNLSPVALEHDPLPDALKKTVANWSERTGITARFTVTGTEHPVHEEIAATLLRIAQEALANAERHSGAARAGVTLSYMGDEITLDVRDDGHGFDPAAVPTRHRTGGFGLDGMRARAERLAGSLALETEPGHGTAISARVPLAPHD